MSSIIFFDIETVSGVSSYDELSDAMKHLRDKKAEYRHKETGLSSDVLFEQKAWIYAEFGKVVCIVAGYHKDGGVFGLQSFAGDDERQLLKDFFDFLAQHPQAILCGHNVKEFDIPYVCRRWLVHGLALPSLLNTQWLKPREVQHRDTMEMWKFGDYKSYTSLALLCELFGIETSKDDIDGSQVSQVYRQDHDLDRIVHYCKKDVVATARVYEKLKQ